MRLISRLATVVLTTLSASAAFALNPSVSLTFFGEARLPVDSIFGGTRIGGLSGIEYDVANNRYFAVSDARNQNAEQTPARFYTLNIGSLEDGLSNADVNAGTFTAVTEIRPSPGNSFPALSLDPEDIVFDPTAPGSVFISSEGDRNNNVNPFINRFDIATGVQNDALPIPARFLINGAGAGSGIRNNLAFESLTVTPNGTLVTATENALTQDGLPTDQFNPNVRSTSRLLTYNLATQVAGAEYVYEVEPLAQLPNPANQFATNGLVDLLALSDTKFLSIERSFAVGALGTGGTGNIIRIFEIDITGATDVSGIDDLDAFVGTIIPVQKTLVFDLNSITTPGFATDNIEGVTFGQNFADGSQSLILVSDDNFSDVQFTQFAAFKVTVVPEAGTATLVVPGLLTLVGGLSVLRRRK